MKFAEEIMEILAAFDLTRSFRDAGELAGCSRHTVEHHVARREAGLLGDEPARRAQILDDFLDKVEEWVEASHGKIRATSPTTSSWRWATRDRSARPGEPWQR